MNNVDLAIQQLRQFQQMLFDRKQSPDDLFNQVNLVIEQMHLASIEINTNYDTISAKLTALMNGSGHLVKDTMITAEEVRQAVEDDKEKKRG